jgi:PiT family inorganic phosphate transporter
MVGAATIATLVVAGIASMFMAWSIGAGSSGSTPFAPAVGANAISVMRAGFIVGVLGFFGAVLQGANVTEAVGKELIIGEPLTAEAATVALLLAAGLVAIGVFAGYPIATAFTVTGAVVGVGLAMGGQPAVDKYLEIATLWVLVPFVGGGVAYGTARILRNDSVRNERSVPALGMIVSIILTTIVDFAILGSNGGGATLAQKAGRLLPGPEIAGQVTVTLGVALLVGLVLWREMRRDSVATQRRFLLVLGGLVAFSAGGSQVGLAIGPMVPLLGDFDVPITAVLVGGGLGLLAGSWTGAPRMIKALSQDYSSLGPRRSIAALIPSFAIAQTAVFFGIPVSFNEIIVSSIIGSGYAAGDSDVSKAKMLYTALAWIGSLCIALGVGYGAFTAIEWLF